MTDERHSGSAYSTDEWERLATRVIDREFDGDAPHVAVAQAVGSLLDADPGELEPLFDSLDPEALDALCRGEPRARLRVSFVYQGCSVTVQCGESTVHVAASTAPSRGGKPDDLNRERS